MELSIFLAQVFGLYFLIIGVIFLWRRKSLMDTLEEFAGNRALLIVVAIIELFAGLSLVVAHNIWVKDFRVVITIVGWWMLVEAVCYLFMPTKSMKRMVKKFNTPIWYVSGSLLSIVIGVYLLNTGFMM